MRVWRNHYQVLRVKLSWNAPVFHPYNVWDAGLVTIGHNTVWHMAMKAGRGQSMQFTDTVLPPILNSLDHAPDWPS